MRLDEIIEFISRNQKGQFENGSGNVCWYLDDLIEMLKTEFGDKEIYFEKLPTNIYSNPKAKSIKELFEIKDK